MRVLLRSSPWVQIKKHKALEGRKKCHDNPILSPFQGFISFRFPRAYALGCILPPLCGYPKNFAFTTGDNSSRSNNVKKSIVWNSRSIAGGPQIFAPTAK
jgi:hypothetical protein